MRDDKGCREKEEKAHNDKLEKGGIDLVVACIDSWKTEREWWYKNVKVGFERCERRYWRRLFPMPPRCDCWIS